MKTKALVAVLFVLAAAFADQTLSASIAYLSGGSKACSYCIPPTDNTFTLNTGIVQGLASISVAGLNANDISSATLNGAFFDCANTDSFNISIGIPQDTSFKLVAGLNGCNNACPYVSSTSATLLFALDASCSGSGVDVTDAVKAVLAAGNDQFVFILNAVGQNCMIMGSGTVECSASVKLSDLKLTITSSSTAEPTCAPCPCGSTSGKRRSGCPVCNVCTTEPPVEATCAPCPCGSSSGKRRSGCPVCNPCPTSACDQTIYNTIDIRSGSSPGGTACAHSSTGYDLTGNSRGPLYVGFPIGNIDSSATVKFYLKGYNCANANRLANAVSTVLDAAATVNEVGGINNCPFIDSAASTPLTFDANCVSQGVDVTAAFSAARSAGNSQLVLNVVSATAIDTTNFCNRFVNPDVEPHFDDNSNCGLHANSRESNPSSFYIVVSSSSCPTNAPSTAAPSTAAPTTEPPVEATCAPCPCGSTSGKRRSGCPVCNVCTTEPPVEATCAPCPCGSTSGKRRSGCPVCKACPTNAPSTTAPTSAPSTKAPTEPPVQQTPAPSTAAPTNAPTTQAPGENISGENNARASGATTVALSGLAVIAAAIALL